MKIGREAAKQMFRDDKNSQGCYRSVMTKIDKIYDSLDEVLSQGETLPIDSVSNNYSKDFKYTLKSKDGKILLQSIVTFGSKKQPFPKNWKEDGLTQIALQNYKEKFINENFDIVISEDMNFDI